MANKTNHFDRLYPISDFFSLFLPLLFQPPPLSLAAASSPVRLCESVVAHTGTRERGGETALSTVSQPYRPRKRYFPAVSFVIRVKNLHRSRREKRLGGGGRRRGGVGGEVGRRRKERLGEKDGIMSGAACLISHEFRGRGKGNYTHGKSRDAKMKNRSKVLCIVCCDDPAERRDRLTK